MSGRDTAEAGDIRAKLLRTEIELSEKKEECGILDRRVQEFQLTLSQVTSECQKAYDLCTALTVERDLAQQNLQEARKKFSDFQNEFQREMKNDLSVTVSELRESLRNKDEAVNTLRKEKSEADALLSKTMDERQALVAEVKLLKDKLEQTEQKMEDLEKQKKLLENERNSQKVSPFQDKQMPWKIGRHMQELFLDLFWGI
ncbi:unnamed protein product [Gongylonema pulchrum]|uniref:Myosin_tail_1 domain-containing protein n=1 Tax=Gongylonema pulchrum TaxID=637853 RepID=A0A183DJB4_9BILA|nr:unnamed protein product [Gongylonema pulchrum]